MTAQLTLDDEKNMASLMKIRAILDHAAGALNDLNIDPIFGGQGLDEVASRLSRIVEDLGEIRPSIPMSI